jgi:hypothetical protein
MTAWRFLAERSTHQYPAMRGGGNLLGRSAFGGEADGESPLVAVAQTESHHH